MSTNIHVYTIHKEKAHQSTFAMAAAYAPLPKKLMLGRHVSW